MSFGPMFVHDISAGYTVAGLHKQAWEYGCGLGDRSCLILALQPGVTASRKANIGLQLNNRFIADIEAGTLSAIIVNEEFDLDRHEPDSLAA